MLPMMCPNCTANRSSNPEYNGTFHVRSYDDPCPVCGGPGRRSATIHLAMACDPSDAHPLLPGSKGILGVAETPKRILCDYGPRLPVHLTSSPNAATCYQCLKVYRQMVSKPVESESL